MNIYTVDELVAVLREDILHADNNKLCQDYVVAMREAASELQRQQQEIHVLTTKVLETELALNAAKDRLTALLTQIRPEVDARSSA